MRDALLKVAPPERGFASDNTAGCHPLVLDAVAEANGGHVMAYGDDPFTTRCELMFTELFGRPLRMGLVFGGTGANVVGLHTICTRDSEIVCTADAHIAIDEAGAPEHITGAQLVGYPAPDTGKLTPDHVDDAAARLGRVHIHDAIATPHVVSVTQATEVGTAYSPDELAAVCDAAHRHQMRVHLDGARLANSLVAWGFGAADLTGACTALADCGVDVVAFGGTKAGLLGAEAVLFLDPMLAESMPSRRKQATQTASKMRFLAAQFVVALDEGRILGWAAVANAAAATIARSIADLPGCAIAYPTDTNAVFATIPRAAVDPLLEWTDCYAWDRARSLVRFVASWDTTEADVASLTEGIAAACRAANADSLEEPHGDGR